MPFTPLHMGPGLLIKGLLQSRFSLMIFGWTQVLMDIQPLVAMTTGLIDLHGFSHTYIGASLIAIVAATSGKWLSTVVMAYCERDLTLAQKRWLGLPSKIVWRVAFVSAFLGSLSHVAIDTIMHADIQPYFPFAAASQLLNIVSVSMLHKLCVYSGIVGAFLYFSLRFFALRAVER